MVNHPNRARKPLSLDDATALVRVDWHAPLPGEPPCGPDEWRQRDRRSVIKIASMDLDHLVHCLRFASHKRHHASKLDVLQAELRKRQAGDSRILDL